MSWDASKPADDEKIADLGTVIRANWDALAGGTVALTSSRYAATSTPVAVASHGFVYAKDVSAKAELHYADEDGNEVQLTTAGSLCGNNITSKAGTDMNITTATSRNINITLGNLTTNTINIKNSSGTNRFSLTAAGDATLTGTLAISSTLAITGATTVSTLSASSDISMKVGDKGDAAQAVNGLMPVAWAAVRDDAGLLGGSNLTIVQNSTGVYTCTFGAGYTPAAVSTSDSYAVFGTAMTTAAASVSTRLYVSIVEMSNTSFKVNIRNDAGTLTNSRFSVVVLDD